MRLTQTRILLLVCVLVANLALVGGPGVRSAYACSCVEIATPAKELESSDAVFVGEVAESGLEDPDPGDNAQFGGIRFDVEKSWKGVSEDSVVIYGQASSYYGPLEEGEMYTQSSCAVNFDRDERYLVFASGDDFLVANACGRTSPLAGSEDALEALGAPEASLPDTGGPGAGSRTGAAVTASALLALAGVLFLRRKIRQTR